jgi:hypothetical protein
MYRIITLLCCLSLYHMPQAQPPVDRVVYATKIPITGAGKKSIGDIVVMPGFHSYLFLKSCGQRQDSTGQFITQFVLGNPNRLVARGIQVIFQFNRSVDTVIYTIEGIPTNPRTTFADNRLGASYSASELTTSGTITATIYSKKKIIIDITGIEGELH